MDLTSTIGLPFKRNPLSSAGSFRSSATISTSPIPSLSRKGSLKMRRTPSSLSSTRSAQSLRRSQRFPPAAPLVGITSSLTAPERPQIRLSLILRLRWMEARSRRALPAAASVWRNITACSRSSERSRGKATIAHPSTNQLMPERILRSNRIRAPSRRGHIGPRNCSGNRGSNDSATLFDRRTIGLSTCELAFAVSASYLC